MNRYYLIEAPSVENPFRNCLLGESSIDEESAWINAFGLKPWTKSQKRATRNAWCREVDATEFYERVHGQG